MKKIVILLCTMIVLTACSAGSSSGTNPTISATSSNCSPITNANQCQITLTYNAGGASNLTLGITYNPQQLAQFTVNGLSSCPTLQVVIIKLV